MLNEPSRRTEDRRESKINAAGFLQDVLDEESQACEGRLRGGGRAFQNSKLACQQAIFVGFNFLPILNFGTPDPNTATCFIINALIVQNTSVKRATAVIGEIHVDSNSVSKMWQKPEVA